MRSNESTSSPLSLEISSTAPLDSPSHHRRTDLSKVTTALEARGASWWTVLRLVLDLVLVGGFLACLFIIIINFDVTSEQGLKSSVETVVALVAGIFGYLLTIWLFELLFALVLFFYVHRWPGVTFTFSRSFERAFAMCCGDDRKRKSPITNVKSNLYHDFFKRLTDNRRYLAKQCSRPSYVVTVMSWNILWCITWLLSTNQWRRDHYTESWDYTGVHWSFFLLQSIFLVGVTIDFCLKVIKNVELIKFIFSLEFVVDVVTLAPVTLIVSYSGQTSLTMREYLLSVGWLRWLRTFVIVRVVSSDVIWRGSVTRARVVQLTLGIVIFLVAFASAMFTAQGVNPYSQLGWSWEIWTWFYFAVVTMSTVGYGDISPETAVQRLITILFIFAILAWVPIELNRVIDAVTDGKQQVGYLPTQFDRDSYILICGRVEPNQLSVIIEEIVNQGNHVKKLVVLTEQKYTNFHEQIALAKSVQVNLCIKYGDLGMGGDQTAAQLCRPADAKAVFVLSNGLTGLQARGEDRQCITRILGLKKQDVSMRRVTFQSLYEDASVLAKSLGCRTCLSVSSIKMKLISKTIDSVAGIIPLFCNLSSSVSPSLRIRGNEDQTAESLCARQEFLKGARCQIFCFRPPLCFRDMTFKELCLSLFLNYEVFLIGLCLKSVNKKVKISWTSWLNPSNPDRFIRLDEQLVILAADYSVPLLLQRLDKKPKLPLNIPPFPATAQYFRPLEEIPFSPDSLSRRSTRPYPQSSVSRHTFRNQKSVSTHTALSETDDHLQVPPAIRLHDDTASQQRTGKKALMRGQTAAEICSDVLGVKKISFQGGEGEAQSDDFGLSDTTVLSFKEAQQKIWRNPQRPFILICGWPADLSVLLKYIEQNRRYNVVILSFDDSRVNSIRPCGYFAAFIKGRATNDLNLIRAGVLEASRFVLFPEHLDDESEVEADELKLTQDRNCVIVNLAIRNLLEQRGAILTKGRIQRRISAPNAKTGDLIETPNLIVAVLHDAETIHFLDLTRSPKVEGDGRLETNFTLEISGSHKRLMNTCEYAVGRVFTESLLYSLIVHNTHVSDVGVHPDVYLALLGLQEDDMGIRLVRSGVYVLSEGKNFLFFRDLFVYFLRYFDLVPIALYRTSTDDLYSHHVMTCPAADAIVDESDLVFVIPAGNPTYRVVKSLEELKFDSIDDSICSPDA